MQETSFHPISEQKGQIDELPCKQQSFQVAYLIITEAGNAVGVHKSLNRSFYDYNRNVDKRHFNSIFRQNKFINMASIEN